MSTPLWTLEGVTLGQRVRDVTLAVVPGVTAVLGHSGAGKTSLLNLLVDFERPDSGALVAHLPRGEHARALYWVPQDDGLWPHLTVREHIEAMGVTSGDGLLGAFDLTHRAAAWPATLSRGERARLSVARALAADAAVLVMDEPLAHVDPARVGGYWDTLRQYTTGAGVSLVFATHAPPTVLAEAGQVICLQEGRLAYAGGVAALYWTPPTPELAVCLGEANWLTPAEARLWLRQATDAARCLRPEQLAVRPAADGQCMVEVERFHGGVAEVHLRHEAGGAVRRFWHRPSGPYLTRGVRVTLEAI